MSPTLPRPVNHDGTSFSDRRGSFICRSRRAHGDPEPEQAAAPRRICSSNMVVKYNLSKKAGTDISIASKRGSGKIVIKDNIGKQEGKVVGKIVTKDIPRKQKRKSDGKRVIIDGLSKKAGKGG